MGDERLLKEIGARIAEIRHTRRMTQEELAEKMDVSVQMISNLEGGKKAIRPENIVKLCSALDVSADYVLRGKMSDYELGELIASFVALSEDKQRLVRELISKLL